MQAPNTNLISSSFSSSHPPIFVRDRDDVGDFHARVKGEPQSSSFLSQLVQKCWRNVPLKLFFCLQTNRGMSRPILPRHQRACPFLTICVLVENLL